MTLKDAIRESCIFNTLTVLIVALLSSLIAFPFQMIRVVATTPDQSLNSVTKIPSLMSPFLECFFILCGPTAFEKFVNI
jgi:hypothetical protein